jgi:hypothetical protein
MVHSEAWNSQIHDAGLKTQNYHKGFDRFIHKFDPDPSTEAVVAIVKGVHHEHGSAILFAQENSRCLLLDTLHGLTDDEALWFTLHSWAKFQPRLDRPRQEPGRLFYPAAYSHVFEKYWDALDQPLAHPDSTSESFFTKACMQELSAALVGMESSSFTPLVDSEARPQCVSVAEQAAISRLCPIQDAFDFWALLEERLAKEGRSSPDTGSGAPAPG